MTMIDTALANMKEQLNSSETNAWHSNSAFRSAEMRLFLEKAGKGEKIVTDEMIAKVKTDVENLVAKGDMNSSNPVLKMMNGSEKRGKPLSLFQIQQARIEGAYHEARNVTEYQLFYTIYCEFGGESDQINELPDFFKN